VTAAQLAAARLREDALRERVRAGLPDSYGPVDLPGGGWKLGMEDGSVLIVACGTGWEPPEAREARHQAQAVRRADQAAQVADERALTDRARALRARRSPWHGGA
jgi:hypothetical protein